jgi:predicted GNAT family N-acyltransferase
VSEMEFREFNFGSAEYRRGCALRQEGLRKPLGVNPYDEDLETERGQRHFGLFDAEGALLGCAIVLPLSPREARIRQMAVDAHCQGKGCGRRIMQELEAWLATQGFSRVIIHARMYAKTFYEKLGYSTVGEQFTEVGIPHVRMVKMVADSEGAPANRENPYAPWH